MVEEEIIQKALEQYKNNLVKYKKIYARRKLDEEFMEANRERARNYYILNPEKKKEYYTNNKEKQKSRSMYNYYKKKDKIDIFKSKYPERYNLLFPQ
tara:strand:- start:111 stop:401 length:291 start_codon:yes stop_codon:yes gene_type:complete